MINLIYHFQIICYLKINLKYKFKMDSSDDLSLLSHLKNNLDLVDILLKFGKVTIFLELLI